MLLTKSIQNSASLKDGIRVCIMRRPPKNSAYDIWIPPLSPSDKLLDAYHAEKIDWKGYEKRFVSEVLNEQKIYLEIVLNIAKKYRITLLCWEKTPKKCHRRLVAEKLKQMDKTLEVVLK